jgi:hypothetical protein
MDNLDWPQLVGEAKNIVCLRTSGKIPPNAVYLPTSGKIAPFTFLSLPVGA